MARNTRDKWYTGVVYTHGGKPYYRYSWCFISETELQRSCQLEDGTGGVFFDQRITVPVEEIPERKAAGLYINEYKGEVTVVKEGVEQKVFVPIAKNEGATHVQMFAGKAFYVPFDSMKNLDFSRKRPIPGNNLKRLKELMKAPKSSNGRSNGNGNHKGLENTVEETVLVGVPASN